MSILRIFIVPAIVTVCAVGSFSGVVGYMAAQSYAEPAATVMAATNISKDSASLAREMSPIYPTTKYTSAQLAPLTVKKKSTAKLVKVRSKNMPLQIAYVPVPRG